ncbi:MAG: protein kinase [Sandaracinaceae bacterium]
MSAPIPFGNYELLERIAEGGMAEVWRARSLGAAGFEKVVVVKRVLPSLLARPGFAELLVREAKIAARLSHPNVVQIFDLGEQDGSYFIAMEYLRGRDLAAALGYRSVSESPLSLPMRVWIAAEVAKALDYAHRARGEDGGPLSIVHRDVSPQNVLLGFEGEVKVADFGISRADEPGLGRGEDPKILRGKYAYMSPEQARGEPLDRRSDLFSFGILLFELLTRRRMFRGRTSQETLELVRAAKLPDWQKRLPLDAVVPILERCLDADRSARWDSAGEIYEALTRLLFSLGEPVGQTDLARAMREMFPPTDQLSPNKLRVDLLIRAYDDATSAGTSILASDSEEVRTARTAALPSRRQDRENRRLAFLVADRRPGEASLFDSIVEETGGACLTAAPSMRIAAFGVSGMERAVGHAARCALELRRRGRLEGPARLERAPPMAVVAGLAQVLAGSPVDVEDVTLERAGRLLRTTSAGEIRLGPDLAGELGRDFRFRAEERALVLEGYRARKDRAAGELRGRAPFVGHREVLRALSGHLLDAARGTGRWVHLVGEPGVGKSRLLAELRAAAAPKDFVFLHGRADEAEMGRSFGALADLLWDLAGIEPEDAPQQRYAKVDRLKVLGLAPREVRSLGELMGLAYPLPPGDRECRPRAVEVALTIRKAIRALSKDRVVVLALEDLQWMDDATTQILPLLVSGLIESRVVLLLSGRPGTVGPLPAKADLVELTPLDPRDTGRLLAHSLGVRDVGPRLASWAHTETGGIPAWIEQVADAVRARVRIQEHVAELEGDEPLPVPEGVGAVVAARIERLRPADAALLRVASALGGTVEVSLISAAEGFVGHTERPAIRRLLVRRLLVSEDAMAPPPERLGAWGGDEDDERLPSRVRVASELLRRAVLDDMDAMERTSLHGRIVATLERLGHDADLEGLSRLATHARLAGELERATRYSQLAAATAREAGRPEVAARHAADAARQMRAAGEHDEAFKLAVRAAEDGLQAGALELTDSILSPLHEDATTPRAEVELGLLRARLAHRRLEAQTAAKVLSDLPLSEVGPELRAAARLILGWSMLELGRLEEAIETLSGAGRGVGGLYEGRSLAALALALAWSDRLTEADRAVSRSLAVAARIGEAHLRYASLASMAALHVSRGEDEDASDRFGEALEVALTADAHVQVPMLAGLAALAALDAGQDEEAARRAAVCVAQARTLRHEGWERIGRGVRGIATDSPEDVSQDLRDSARRLESIHRPLEALFAYSLLSKRHARRGRNAASAQSLQRAIALAREAGFTALARRLERSPSARQDPP